MPVPQGPAEITSEWMSSTIGRNVSVENVEQIGVGVGLLGRLYRATLAGGESVIVKLPTLDDAARMNVIEPLRFYEKEIRFYENAAADTPIGTPRVHATQVDVDTGDFVLVIEDLSDRRIPDQTVGCPPADAELAVDAMADVHARWWQSERFADMPWLAVYSDPPYPQIIAAMFKQAWPIAEEILGEKLPSAYRDYGDRFPDLVQWFLDLGSGEPQTLCHGDFRLDNLFFAATDDHPPVTIVDWQICFRGRGGYDLGYFLSQSMATDDRRKHETALLDRYHGRLSAKGIDYPRNLFEEDYRRTVAYCFAYPVISAGQIEFTNERHRQLIEGMLAGSIAAIEDNDALSLLPE